MLNRDRSYANLMRPRQPASPAYSVPAAQPGSARLYYTQVVCCRLSRHVAMGQAARHVGTRQQQPACRNRRQCRARRRTGCGWCEPTVAEY